MAQPTHIWVPSIGISGMMFYTGDRFPEWRGDMFVAGLRGQKFIRLTLEGREVVGEETLIRDMGRIRDVRQAPDGTIYLAMDGDARGFDGDPTPILRLVPAGTR
jgi:glucose/arabinose dehydrogenase